MAQKLTPKLVDNAKPRAARFEIPDGGCPGLYLVVQPTGAKSWALRYRVAGRAAKLTLGRAIVLRVGERTPSLTDNAPLTLAAARELAARERRRIELGADPAMDKRTQRADAVSTLAEQFLEQHAAKKRPQTLAQYRSILRRLVLPAWDGRTVHSIRRRDVIDLAQRVARDRPILANRTLATVSKFFAWLVARDVIPASPVVGVERPVKERARERTLTDAELRAIWHAAGELGYPFGPCVRMLILTGCRRSEVTGARWDEIKDGTWTIPGERVKNHLAHAVPLSRQAVELLDSVPRIVDCDFIFTANGQRPIHSSSFGRAKTALDKLARLAPWTIHDLRRTAASGMQRLGVEIAIIEKCLNHTSGTFRGIVGTYQRHSYAAEKRAALQQWSDHVEALAAPRSHAS
jgi:integrase